MGGGAALVKCICNINVFFENFLFFFLMKVNETKSLFAGIYNDQVKTRWI